MNAVFPSRHARAWRFLAVSAVLAYGGLVGCGDAGAVTTPTDASEAIGSIEPPAIALASRSAGSDPEPASAEDSLASNEDLETVEDRGMVSTTDSTPAPGSKTANPRLHSVRKVRLVAQSPLVARTGPGDRFAIAGVYGKGDAFPVVAKNGEWFGVRISGSETGWFHASLCEEFDDVSDLEFQPNPKAFSRVGSYVLNAYAGAYSFDRKSNTLVLGGRIGYYVFERFQAEAGIGWTHVRRPAEIVESLFGLSLEAEDFHMLFYQLNVTWEILPGRQMVPYLTAGVGSSIMQGETEPSLNFGAGTTLFFSKRTAMRWEFRDYRFQSGPDGARVTNDNIEFTLGTVFLF